MGEKRKKTRLDIKLLRKRINKCNILINVTNKPLQIFFCLKIISSRTIYFNYKE